jgi:shikimate kinase
MRRHLVLVGLPGAGKSTVGRIAAERLGCPFVDLDERIASRTGKPVAEIFATRGEPAFRELEREAMDLALAGEPSVIAPGGGWAAQPGNLAAAEPRAILVYLAVSPAAAAARLARSADRPLLAGGEHREMLDRLLVAREPFYRLASQEVDAEAGSPQFVAEGVVAAALRSGL